MQTGRKDFLRMMAAVAALRPSLANAAPQQTAGTGERKQPFVQRVIEDYAAALGCALCYIGDRLGLFKVMAKSGPVTAVDLARKTHLNARMLREWLNGLTAAGYLEYRPLDKTYILPNDHAEVLADEESSPMFRGGLFQFLVPCSRLPHKLQTHSRQVNPQYFLQRLTSLENVHSRPLTNMSWYRNGFRYYPAFRRN